ncbi:MAG: lamin tail domain-containing protein [Cyclobacteriaceae bacterium]
MKKFVPIIFLLALTTVCFCQVSDDFSDGDFTNNPAWSGSTSHFIVNSSKQLQLNNTVAGTSYLSTPFNVSNLGNYEWRVYAKLGFAPSGTNFGRIYLVSDQADLTQPLNGYYLQLGEALSNDAVQLFKQSGAISTSTSVCRGTNATIANAFALSIKVTRDAAGNWSLFVDYSGTSNFPSTPEASGVDNTFNSSGFFGVLCTYTVTNSTRFTFDNVAIIAPPAPPPDTTPPTIVKVDTLSVNSLSILFSEEVELSSASNMLNYLVNNSVGNPVSAILQSNNKTILLTFVKNFPNGIQSQIEISEVKDLAGNVMSPATFNFLYFHAVAPSKKDILFTEIFADPSPQVGLPAQEYLEIYNRSANPFNISGWKLSDGSSTATFGNQYILPNQYWIVCSSSNASLFSGYGKVIGVSNFPTLNNSGDNLTLRDNNGKTIDSVSYALDWYHDVDKQDGGWALEIIDPNNLCGEGENWSSSENPSGGTPGQQNSIFANKPDLIGPQLLSVTPQSPTFLNLIFNEKLEKDLFLTSFTLSPSTSISKKYFVDQSLRQIALELNSPLDLRLLYTITVSNLNDCSGNSIQKDFSQLSFALPEAADSLDIVVNEILFNPKTGGVDFVEAYNNSPKYINLKNWKLANYESDSASNLKTISTSDFILAPASYLVFTSNPSLTSLQYPQSIQKVLFKTTLPSMSDDEGSIAIINEEGKTIDHFSYSEKMHSPFVKDNEGVSLERISFSVSTDDPNNWKSANASVGFATPGFLNSNSRPESIIVDAITIDPEIFSPTIAGKDFSKINYKFEESGMAANVKILDVQGRLIKTLANNETLAHEGFFRWDGDRDDGSHARIGYYVVWFEVYDARGFQQVFRKRAVIGR